MQKIWLAFLTVAVLSLMSCGNPPERQKDSITQPAPLTPDRLPEDKAGISEKASEADILALNDLIYKSMQLDILNLWLEKAPEQPDTAAAADLDPLLTATLTAIKSQCQIEALNETSDIKLDPKNKKKSIRLKTTDRQQTAKISGANCAVYSTFEANGKRVRTSELGTEIYRFSVSHQRNILDASVAGVVGLSKSSFIGDKDFRSNEKRKFIKTTGHGVLQLNNGQEIKYSLAEEKVEVFERLKTASKEVRRNYSIEMNKNINLVLEAKNNAGVTKIEVRINGHRVQPEEAPALHKAAARLILF